MKRLALLFTLLCVTISGGACSDDNSEDTYKVGDYYDRDGIQGIVFKTENGGRNGLIVSLDETTAAWALDNGFEVNASDSEDGTKNQAAVEAIPGWREKFPAFVWCADKNVNGVNGWFLPAGYCLSELFWAWAVDREAFNRRLIEHGGTGIMGGGYWSSTAIVQYTGGFVNFSALIAPDSEERDHVLFFAEKTNRLKVRAVCRF